MRPLNFGFLAHALCLNCANADVFNSERRESNKHVLSTSQRLSHDCSVKPYLLHLVKVQLQKRASRRSPGMLWPPGDLRGLLKIYLAPGSTGTWSDPGSNWDTGRINFLTMTCVEPRAGQRDGASHYVQRRFHLFVIWEFSLQWTHFLSNSTIYYLTSIIYSDRITVRNKKYPSPLHFTFDDPPYEEMRNRWWTWPDAHAWMLSLPHFLLGTSKNNKILILQPRPSQHLGCIIPHY